MTACNDRGRLNQKGGVGKTTVTLGLASRRSAAGRACARRRPRPAGVEQSGSSGVDPGRRRRSRSSDVLATKGRAARRRSSGVSGVVRPRRRGAGERRRSRTSRPATSEPTAQALLPLVRVIDGYDAVLIDCPPSLGNLTTNALAAARHALVVVEPSALGLRGIGGVADAIDDVWDAHNPDLELSGVILNRVPAISSEAERRIAELARIVGRQAIWTPAVPASGDPQPGGRRTPADPLLRAAAPPTRSRCSTSCGRSCARTVNAPMTGHAMRRAAVATQTGVRRQAALPDRRSAPPCPTPDRGSPPRAARHATRAPAARRRRRAAARRCRPESPASWCRSSRLGAICETHAEISVIAGRRLRSRSSDDLRRLGWRRLLAALDRSEDLVGDAAFGVSVVHPAGLAEFLERGRAAAARCPRMARSGRTWRTGMSTRIARSSRQAASDWAIARPFGRSDRASFSRSQASCGIRAARRTRAQFLAGILGPLEAPHLLELRDQSVVHVEQVLHVGCRVLALVVGQRASDPVGQPVALGRGDPDLALEERHERGRAVADEAAGDLRVEHSLRNRPDRVGEHVEVLLGRMDDAERIGGEQPPEVRHVQLRADRSGRVPASRSSRRATRRSGSARASGSTCAHGGTRCRVHSAASRAVRRRVRRARPGCRSNRSRCVVGVAQPSTTADPVVTS